MSRVSGGTLAVDALVAAGVGEMFTLSGGHIFPILDAAATGGLRIVDVRHEQTAAFGAEGVGKLTRRPGVAVLTAGPGVTNGISALAAAIGHGSPMVVLAGRAPQARWGAGSLQELDHVPVVATITKHAATVTDPAAVTRAVADALRLAAAPPRGPVFLDFPLDVLFASGAARVGGDADLREGANPQDQASGGATPDADASGGGTRIAGAHSSATDPGDLDAAAALLRSAERPVLIAGSGVWLGHAEHALGELARAASLPVFMNGLGRGCLAADDTFAFSRARSRALRDADVVVVAGTPLDFRLGFGRFGDGTAKVVHLVEDAALRSSHAPVACTLTGDLAGVLASLATALQPHAGREQWLQHLHDAEAEARAKDRVLLENDASPIHPARIYGDLAKCLDRDAIVIGDGGDFVSYAGRLVDTYTPGCWLDPGPYGCLGSGIGYAAAARVVHPDRQVVLLSGDGAFGFCGMDVDTLVRHRLGVVIVVGNNGIWGLEKHPMRALYGYDVAADLQAGCGYDRVVTALGGGGETVTSPGEIGPALARGFAASRDGVPYLVNVLTDPDDVYPRSSNLA